MRQLRHGLSLIALLAFALSVVGEPGPPRFLLALLWLLQGRNPLRNKTSPQAERSHATLEEVFLKLTHEEEEVAETVRALREALATPK